MALSLYKKGQGTAARSIGGVVVLLLGGWAAHQMWFATEGWALGAQVFATALVAFALGALPLYLILFHQTIGELLIETQQEMRKVAWSTREEVTTSTIVVVVTVVLLALFILATDTIVYWLMWDIVGLY